MIVVISGPPGSGKDTQAERLAHILNAHIISPGALLRAEAKQNQELDIQLKRGDLANDDHVNRLVGEEMLKHKSANIILDGTPRHLPQVSWLMEFIEKNFKGASTILIRLQVPDDVLKERARKRGREDDNPVSFEHRLDIYHAKIVPAINELEHRMPTISVDGEQSIEKIADFIQSALSKKGYL